jgi:hypothetical protein
MVVATMLGSGEYRYEELGQWAKRPAGWSFHEVVDVAVDAQDRVYVFNRGEHPMIVFEADGTFVSAWGEGMFGRPHGVTMGPDGALYCADDVAHCIHKCSLAGEVLMTIGTPGQPAPVRSNRPFNRPTKVAFAPDGEAMYISDGYGNGCVHKFTLAGEHILTWGEHGTDPGQFNLVHSVATDTEGRVYIADRENCRVQVFDEQGAYISQWNNMYRPCGLRIDGDLAYVGQLPTSLPVNADYPNIGACVSIHDLSGRRLARLGAPHKGEGPGQFLAPHGLTVDSRGDVYVGEVSYAEYGRKQDPPREVRSFRKLVRMR